MLSAESDRETQAEGAGEGRRMEKVVGAESGDRRRRAVKSIEVQI